MRKALLERLRTAPAEFAAGDFQRAAVKADAGYRDAVKAGEPRIAAMFLNNLGGSRLALHQYREALKAFSQASRIAESQGDRSTAGKLFLNISSLYSQLGELDSAVSSGERAMTLIPPADRFRYKSHFKLQIAIIRAQQNRFTEAERLFRRGVQAADRAGDREIYASGWNNLGEEYLHRGRLEQAQQALLEAYRVRKLYHLRTLDASYVNLGMLLLSQGRLQAASHLLDKVVDGASRPGGLRPDWEAYYSRGLVRHRQGRLTAALKDLRIAVCLAGTWRRSVPPNDATRISAENSVQSVHAALIESADDLYRSTHDPSLRRETFEAAEANRAASLRALLSEPRMSRQNLTPEYWETLQKLEAAESTLIRAKDGDAATAETIRRLRAKLTDLESQVAPVTAIEASGLLARTRIRLAPDTVYLSFHLASPHSFLWAVSRHAFRSYRLASGTEIARLADGFVKSLRSGQLDAPVLGARLYSTLFGPLDEMFVRRTNWLLSLDQGLFAVPFSALTVSEAGKPPVYLIERHSLEVVPGAGTLVASRSLRPNAPEAPFLGVGDPVYNAADPRWRKSMPPRVLHGLLLPGLFAATLAVPSDENLNLSRLAGSGREIEACAAAWRTARAPVLLRGMAANIRGIQNGLERSPGVLHFATHVVHSSGESRSGFIVLSLKDNGQHEILGPAEISTWHVDGTVVALSGCSSGLAAVLPGTGLMGLTRAWLTAGARAIVASLWPSPDDTGTIFLSFYRHLKTDRGSTAAVGLRNAQLEMLRSHSWRSNPIYWASYFITGNQQ